MTEIPFRNTTGLGVTIDYAESSSQERSLPPEPPSLAPREWLQRNLFSNFASGFMTVLSVWAGLWAARGLLQFTFSEQRDWDSVRFNMRLLFTQAYPSEQYVRVWVSVGVVLAIAGLSLGLARRQAKVSAKRLASALMGIGAVLALCIILREPSVIVDTDGIPIRQEVPSDSDGGSGLLDLVLIVVGLIAVAIRVIASRARNWVGLSHASTQPIDRAAAVLGSIAGAGIIGSFLLAPWAFRSDSESLVRESFGAAMKDRAGWWLAATVLFALGALIWFGLGDAKRRKTFVSAIHIFFVGVGLVVLSAWVFPWGSYTFDGDGFTAAPGDTVSLTTKGPWTVMLVVMVMAFVVGRRVCDRPMAARVKPVLGLLWILSPFLLFWVILRDPAVDWDHVFSTDLPMALAFAVGGAGVLYLLTRVDIGELGRVIAVTLLLWAAFNWLAAFAGWYPMLQKARFSFLLLALFALAASNFASEERRQRMKLIWGWLLTMAILHYLVTLVNSPSTVETPTEGFLGGFAVTIFVAVFTIICSFPLGVVLALGRTSKLPIFRVLCTVFIECVRGIPLITILFFMANILPLFLPEGMDIGSLAAVTVGFILFSAAYLAENLRGGLQAVRQGQYEAADALGLTPGQRTSFIVLPQGLRVSIPPLVGQAIATLKETSLLSIIGVFDILYIANRAIPAQTEFLGSKREALLFISIIYWVFAYSMSKYSQSLEKRLGVGER